MLNNSKSSDAFPPDMLTNIKTRQPECYCVPANLTDEMSKVLSHTYAQCIDIHLHPGTHLAEETCQAPPLASTQLPDCSHIQSADIMQGKG